MKTSPYKSCWIKIDRAKTHYNELQRDVERFKAQNPYRIIVDEDSEPSIKLYRLHVAAPVPEVWSAVIGDVIHNLRAAMDSLATQIVIAAGCATEGVLRKTYFPIRANSAGMSDDRALKFYALVGPKIEKLFRRLQPYRGGIGDVLWRVDQLDILDKHRAIIPVGVNLAQVTAHWENGEKSSPLPPTAAYPLREGDVIFRSLFFEPHFDARTHFVFDIAFGEGQVADGEPVLPTLSTYINFVERLTFLFEKNFF